MPETQQPSLEEKMKGSRIATKEEMDELLNLFDEEENTGNKSKKTQDTGNGERAPTEETQTKSHERKNSGSDVLSPEEIDELLLDAELHDTKAKLTPERVAQAWGQLNRHEQQFLLRVTDEKIASVIGKVKDKSEKARVMLALRKLIQTNDPRASKIKR